jgi:hypothetical protein
MSTSITIQLPEEVLIEALQQLSPERRRRLLQQVSEQRQSQVVTLPADALQGLRGIIAIGGDALAESDYIYDE